MPHILVVAPNWIGDALMAQPLLTRLKQGGATIDVLAPEWVAPVARRMPEVSDVVAAPFRHGPLQLRERWAYHCYLILGLAWPVGAIGVALYTTAYWYLLSASIMTALFTPPVFLLRPFIKPA